MNFPRRQLTRLLSLCLASSGMAMLTRAAHAQALPAAVGPGTYLSVGGGASAFQSDYGKLHLVGLFAFADLHLTSRYGVELEARTLRYHTQEQVQQSNYLVGPHIYGLNHGRFEPYAKFLVGVGHMQFPYKYADGNYLALAPGAGLDFRLSDRISVRVIDAEYQVWPQFTYGSLHPYGVSAGINIRILKQSIYPVPYTYKHDK